MEGVANNQLSYRSIFSEIKRHVRKKPQENAIIEVSPDASERSLKWLELESSVNKLSHALKREGVRSSVKIVIGLPNCIENVISNIAVWHLGACAVNLNYGMTESERNILLDLIKPELVISDWDSIGFKNLNVTSEYINGLEIVEDVELPDLISQPCRGVATGGSTGIPKIIVDNTISAYSDKDYMSWNMVTGQKWEQTQLIAGAMYHSLFNTTLYFGLSMGHKIIIMKRFDEALLLKLVEKYKVNSMALVPTMMSRIIHSPAITSTDLSSLQTVFHSGSVCPIWLKRAWIDLLGPKKIHEFYSMSEKIGMTHIRGDEWLEHEGSVGRSMLGDIKIIDENGNSVPPGTIGRIFFKPIVPPETHYLNSKNYETNSDGAITVGDLGWLDDDGYLYFVDRRIDMIVSGGKNVYAAEVENVIREYYLVRDVAVIGLPDKDWGKRVHAIIEPSTMPEEFPIEDLAIFIHNKISSYKCPKTVELVEKLPRDGAGKLRRKSLAEERFIGDSVSDKFKIIQFPHVGKNGH